MSHREINIQRSNLLGAKSSTDLQIQIKHTIVTIYEVTGVCFLCFGLFTVNVSTFYWM